MNTDNKRCWYTSGASKMNSVGVLLLVLPGMSCAVVVMVIGQYFPFRSAFFGKYNLYRCVRGSAKEGWDRKG
jgi:hypothetical protein